METTTVLCRFGYNGQKTGFLWINEKTVHYWKNMLKNRSVSKCFALPADFHFTP
jgi:hypothetical protein